MSGATDTDGIRAELERRLIAAMRARDTRTADTIRAVRAKVLEEQKKEGGAGASGDALFVQVIDRYVKQLEKALPEFERGGAAAAGTIDRYRFEIGFLREFLPTKRGEEETRALVRETIASLGLSDPRQLGRVMGAVMKDRKDELDAQLVRRLVEEELA
jgi:hypothetical protein